MLETAFGQPELVHPFAYCEEVVVLPGCGHVVHSLVGEVEGGASQVLDDVFDALAEPFLVLAAAVGNEMVVLVHYPVGGVVEDHGIGVGGVGRKRG